MGLEDVVAEKKLWERSNLATSTLHWELNQRLIAQLYVVSKEEWM
jgi:hypothetical protein